MNKTFLFFAALLMLFCGAATVVTAYRLSQREAIASGNLGSIPDHLKKPDIPADELLTNYTLTERSGDKFESKELDGAVHVAGFFFSTCPSTCRAQNEALRTLHQQFGSKGVRFLSITVDPKKDTPATLSEYASLFGAHPTEWLFLTGNLDYTRRIGAEFYQMHVEEGVHMNRLAVVDKWGKLRGRFKWQEEIEVKKMNEMINTLLEETEPPKEEKAEFKPRESPDEEPEDDDGRVK